MHAWEEDFVTADKIHYSKLETGYSSLDRFMGPLEAGRFYVFYGSSFLEDLILRLVVRASRLGTVLFFENSNNPTTNSNLILSKLRIASVEEHIDPNLPLARVRHYSVRNEAFLERLVQEACYQIIKGTGIRLIVLSNVTLFLQRETRLIQMFNRVIGMLWQACNEHNVMCVLTSYVKASSTELVPYPRITSFIMHLAKIVMFFDESGNRVRAVLIKHPSRETPSLIEIQDAVKK